MLRVNKQIPLPIFEVVMTLPGGRAGWRDYWNALQARSCCDVELCAGVPGKLILEFRRDAPNESEVLHHIVSDVLEAISAIRALRGPKYMDFQIEVRTPTNDRFRGSFELSTWRPHGREQR